MTVVVAYCKRRSSTTKGNMADTMTNEEGPVYDVAEPLSINTLHIKDTPVIFNVNPSYGTTPEIKKQKEFDDDRDYVVSTEEMIKTNTNPSYVPLSVGNNLLDNNPSYHTSCVAV